MKCTFLKPLSVKREYTEVFGGYDGRARIADGYFADMKELSSHAYPLMATRRAREVLMRANGLQGVLVKDKAAWVAEGKLYYDGAVVEGLTLSDGDKTLLSMGARIIVYPDMVSYNTLTGEVETLFSPANLEKTVTVEEEVGGEWIVVDEETGEEEWVPRIEEREETVTITFGIYPYYDHAYDGAKRYTSLPDGYPLEWDAEEIYHDGVLLKAGWRKDEFYTPIEGSYAYSCSASGVEQHYARCGIEPIYQYKQGQFVPVEPTMLAAVFDNTMSNLTDIAGALPEKGKFRIFRTENAARSLIFDIETVKEAQIAVDGSHMLTDTTLFVLKSDLPASINEALSGEWIPDIPSSPILDGLLENGNRLWGWRYGEAMNGETVNEIYSTALGLPAGWNQFEGLPSDSYVVGVGSDGVFTGAAYYSGSMYFFKENCYHRVMGKKPSNYQLVTVTCTGVEIGSEKSLVTAGDALYYKGEDGFYRFDGSIPYKISDTLGDSRYKNAVGGVLGDRIYWDCETDGGRVMLVYDLVYKLWYKESSLCAREMVPAFGNLLVRGEDGLYLVDGENVDARFGEVFSHEGEGAFRWFGELGDLGLSDLNAKYVSRIVLRATIEEGARATVSLLRDSKGDWETVAVMSAKRKETASVPITVPRCDHFRIRIEGVGGFKLWGLARDIEKTNEIRR